MNSLAAALVVFSIKNPITWPRVAPDTFGCSVEREFNHKDTQFNCSLSGYKPATNPCSESSYYDGPQIPDSVATRFHPKLKEIGLEWEGGRLRAANFRFAQDAKKADVESALGLPKQPLPENVLSARFDDCANDRVCYLLEGFEHMGAGDVECQAEKTELREGNYTGPEGYWMVLKEAKMGAFDVVVEFTDNPKACRLKGIRSPGDEGTVEAHGCKFILQPSRQGEAVISIASGSEQACAIACSGKTSFAGTYGFEKSEPMPVACDISSVKKLRAEAAKAIAAKYYDEGIVMLERIKSSCPKLKPDEVSWILNDIAYSQIRAGRGGDCSATLKSLKKFASSSDTSRLKKATLANMKSCAKVAKP